VAERDTIAAVLAARGRELFVHRAAGAIALPKARSPIICPDVPAMVPWWWCGDRLLVPGGAPVSVVFLIFAPTIKQHLQLLSRLSLALHDRELATALGAPGAADQVLAEARRWELALPAAPPGSPEPAR
jgi:hypothetical protein